jgi:hypothetical protein
MKLNVLLAKTEHSANSYKTMNADYITFFAKDKDHFRGIRKTYTPKPDTPDYPNERGTVLVQTTVEEKLDWFKETAKDYIDNLFAVEATNASNLARVELVVDNINFGRFSTLELLRLKSLLESSDLERMYSTLPVRSDAEIWQLSTDPLYRGRQVYQKDQVTGENKTTLKESYILPDPNLQHLSDTKLYVPQIASKDTVVILGNYTIDFFSGETTHRHRAEILRRRSKLRMAVIEKLKEANEVDAVQSDMTAEKLFNYLHKGTI